MLKNLNKKNSEINIKNNLLVSKEIKDEEELKENTESADTVDDIEVIEEKEDEYFGQEGKNEGIAIENKEDTIMGTIKGAIASKSRSTSRASAEVGVMTIVKAKTGKRITLSKNLMDKLNNPNIIKIAFTKDSIIIGEDLPQNDSSFNIKRSTNKGIIYSTQLVNEISELFGLDFMNKSSITLHESEYCLNEDYPVAIIKVK